MITTNLMPDIYEAGRHDARMGQHLNPYATDTAEHHCWARGWLSQTAEIAAARALHGVEASHDISVARNLGSEEDVDAEFARLTSEFYAKLSQGQSERRRRMNAPILPTYQDGANELAKHMAADPEFGFYLASFMRRAGAVEIAALKNYIEGKAAELNAAKEDRRMAPIDIIHRNLLYASREIGGVHEASAWASLEVAELIAATGIPVVDLTVGELRKIIREHSERLRQRYREENARAARARVEVRS